MVQPTVSACAQEQVGRLASPLGLLVESEGDLPLSRQPGAAMAISPSATLRVELDLLDALEQEPGRFVPAATLRDACSIDDLRRSPLDTYLRDLGARLDQLGLARIERGAGASYRLTWRSDDRAA